MHVAVSILVPLFFVHSLSAGLLPMQAISTFHVCPASRMRGHISVAQLPWCVRSKPASEPVMVSIEKRHKVASVLRSKRISCCNQLFPIRKLCTAEASPVLSKRLFVTCFCC